MQTLNARYIPQLQEVLRWRQSAGIVGGRPGSSLYFIGCQDQSVLFLDPHTLQQVGTCVQPLPALGTCSVIMHCGVSAAELSCSWWGFTGVEHTAA